MSVAGRRYFTYGTQAVDSSTDSVLGITSTTAVRPSIYDIIIGSQATPADNAIVWQLQRHTAAGTSTAFTPVALDPGDPASTASSGANHTAEPTYTASALLWYMALNQRATHRWIADPNGALKLPASANNGATMAPVHSSFTGVVDCTMYFAE